LVVFQLGMDAFSQSTVDPLMFAIKQIHSSIFFNQSVFRSTLKSRPNKVGLRCPYVRPSTKSSSDSDEIGRGR